MLLKQNGQGEGDSKRRQGGWEVGGALADHVGPCSDGKDSGFYQG